ncbi:sulfatase-like hydrolase/transferase [Maribellus comscasis]|uniref:Sulfatase-like hydrolase/transferase n=1 Tax=Maribellus comscasis TaxID=2681766 RepID=A0A6I6JTT3_9BACT|nr:arylsulfatase [Maribellus comscasis]QGY46495.1 sulfatase-like hydrolase/transferase [Maribellus comscasis]
MNKINFNNLCFIRNYVKSCLFFGLFIIGACHNEPAEIENHPNVILIMADDQGWGDAELNGNNIIETPTLNRIASEGVQFERLYVCPMCAPTRASLLTGRYNLRCGTSWVGRRTEMLGLDEVTAADVFKSAGYATGCFGKWHLGLYKPYHPNNRGFDEFTGFLHGALNNYFNSHLDHNGEQITTDQYITDYLTDRALDFIESNKDQPFFCYIPYNVPHHPFQVPRQYYEKYIEKGVADDRTAAVYAMVDEMDENIGRIMSKLEELNLDENTILIFLSDNGPAFHRFNDGLAGIKAQVSEGSVRVPLYLRWKGHIPENNHIYDIAGVIDILPTLIDLTGIKAPDNVKMDGVSLVPLINGESNLHPERMIFTHQTRFGKNVMTPGGVRTQRYRLVNNNSKYELYDMYIDPSQRRDISSDKPEITEKLKEAYENWYKDVTSKGTGSPSVPVGYPGQDTVRAVAPDAILKGGVGYNGVHGWAYNWIVNWKSVNDSVIWPVQVYQSGNYKFNLLYTCDEADIGSEMQLSVKNEHIRNIISKAHSPGKIVLPSVVSKDSPSLKESWAKLPLGTMALDTGRYDIVLQAVKIPGNIVGEFRALEIIKNNN